MNKLSFIFILFLAFNSNAYGWEQMSDFGGEARHRTPMITIGNKIYTGLGHYNGAGPNILFDDWWQYDPGTNTWSQKADYGGGICYHAAGFAIGNFGYVGTGRITASGNTLTQAFYKYSPATNTWTSIASFPGAARRGAVAFVIDDYGYVGTGETNGSSGVQDFYRYDPTSNQWTSIASLPGLGRTSSVAFSIGNYGYVGTGRTTSGSTNDFWRYSPTTNSWAVMADVGPINRQEAMGFALNGKGYIGTGDNYSSGTNYGDFYEYIPFSNTWIQLEDFPGSARRYFAATTYNGKAYAGLGTNGTNFKDFWMFDQTLSLLERNLIQVDLSAFPNPVVNEIQFTINGIDENILNDFQLMVTSMDGKIVYSQNIENSETIINMESELSGTYIYSLIYGKKLIETGRIVKY